MREILFKAKRLDNGEWVIGGTIVQFKDNGVLSVFIPAAFETCVCEHDNETDDVLSFSNCRFYKVDPETVCQYTGLTDKNGVKIFEGDVVNVKTSAYLFESVYVEWNQEDSAWCFRCANMDRFRMLDAFSYEVVGNIHDDA